MEIIHLFLVFCMLAVMWFDMTGFRIPNWISGGMILAYVAACFLTPMPWEGGLQAMLIFFVVGYAVYALNLMGGGDIKLLVACALWIGKLRALDFIFLVALIGGVFAVALWLLRKVLAFLPLKKVLPRIIKEGEPIPYGVAIALGFLLIMFTKHSSIVV